MFGLNTKVGKSFFKDAGDKIKVSSLFFSHQGEGPLRGRPAIFVRFSHCNLSCSWCDAFFEEGTFLTIDEIMERSALEIKKFFNEKNKLIPDWAAGYDGDHSIYNKREIAFIVTGGEPTLQSNLFDLLERASQEYKWTQIETNGVIAPIVPDSTIVVMSPKCMEKVKIEDGFKRYEPIGYMTPNQDSLKRADVLKFIMEDQPNFNSPYQTVPDWGHEWKRQTGRDIFVSPMNIYKKEPKKSVEFRQAKQSNESTLEERSMYDEVISWWEPGLFDMEANQRNHEHAAKYALEHGFIFQMQLHLFASFA